MPALEQTLFSSLFPLLGYFQQWFILMIPRMTKVFHFPKYMLDSHPVTLLQPSQPQLLALGGGRASQEGNQEILHLLWHHEKGVSLLHVPLSS